MSFSLYLTFTKTPGNTEVADRIAATQNIPGPIAAYVLDGVEQYPDGTIIDIVVHGHARGSYAGDNNPHTASITVKEATPKA